MLAFQWLIQKEKRPTKSLINCPRATGSDTWCHPLGVCRWLKSLAELHLHRAHTWARLKNKSEVSGRLTVLTTSFSHCVRRRSCSRSWSALQPPDTSGGEEKEKKKAFPRETRNTNKLYYSTWQEIDPHICLHQAKQQKKSCGGPEIWLHSRWRSQVY